MFTARKKRPANKRACVRSEQTHTAQHSSDYVQSGEARSRSRAPIKRIKYLDIILYMCFMYGNIRAANSPLAVGAAAAAAERLCARIRFTSKNTWHTVCRVVVRIRVLCSRCMTAVRNAQQRPHKGVVKVAVGGAETFPYAPYASEHVVFTHKHTGTHFHTRAGMFVCAAQHLLIKSAQMNDGWGDRKKDESVVSLLSSSSSSSVS